MTETKGMSQVRVCQIRQKDKQTAAVKMLVRVAGADPEAMADQVQ